MDLPIIKILILFQLSNSFCKYVGKDIPELKWPEKYSFKLTKNDLTSDFIEDIQYWHTNDSLRIESDDHAAITITKEACAEFEYGVSYKIHHEPTVNNTYKKICVKKEGDEDEDVYITNPLFDVSSYKYQGDDILEAGKVAKFQENYKDWDINYKNTLWAKYDNNTKYWIPVRHEKLAFHSWLGKVKEHFVEYYTNFVTEFEETVFDIDEENCDTLKDETPLAKPLKMGHSETADLASNRYYTNNRANELGVKYLTDRTPLKAKTKRTQKTTARAMRLPSDSHSKSKLPKELDLRLLGIVSPARNQFTCNSSWAFSSTSAVEGALARSTGTLIKLSEQALIDCAWSYGASGCDGAKDTAAFEWIKEFGLPAEDEYAPYKNRNGFCKIQNMSQKYKIKGVVNVTPLSTTALKTALVDHGPVSAVIHETESLKSYQSGIFYDINWNINKLNHAVTVVGYGKKDGEEYWIVKNSYGTQWGIDGYFHLSMRDNNCGIMTKPKYVLV